MLRPAGVPGAEHGVAGHLKLPEGVLRKAALGFLLDKGLKLLDEASQVAGGKIAVELRFLLFLDAFEDGLEIIFADIEYDAAKHLNEAAVAVAGEARVARLAGENFDRFVVQAEIQNGVHHAGHREFRAGANAQQQRVLPIAELLTAGLFKLLEL